MFDLLIDSNTKKLITNNNNNLNSYLFDNYKSLLYLTNSRENKIIKDNLYEHCFNYFYLYDCFFKNLIVHPLENNIIRNIYGDIINKDEIYVDNYNNLPFPIFKKYIFEDLINKYLSLNLIIDKHNPNDENNYIKSMFAKKLSSIIDTDIKDENKIQFSLMLLLGKKLNIYDDIVYIVFLLLNKDEEILKNVKILNTQSEIYNLYLNFKFSKNNDFNFYSSNFELFKNNTVKYNSVIQLSNFFYDFKDLKDLSFYDKLTFILLISFNNNVFKKIPGINKGINLFIPNNILNIDKTILNKQAINENIIYIKYTQSTINNIITTNISLLHSFDKSFLKYISNIIVFNYNKIKQNIRQINNIDKDINIENYKLTLSYILSLLRLIKYYKFNIYNNVSDININEIDCWDLIEPENYNHLLFKSFCDEKKFELFISKYIFKPIISNKYIIYFNVSQNDNGIYLILNYLPPNAYISVKNLYFQLNNLKIEKQIKGLTEDDIKIIKDCYNSNDSKKLIDFNMFLDSNKKDLNKDKIKHYYLSCHTFNPEFNYFSTLHIRDGDYKNDLKEKDNKPYYALIYENNSLKLNFTSGLKNAYSKQEFDALDKEEQYIIKLLINNFNECYNSFLAEL